MHKAVAIIPARFASTRLQGKPLAILKEKPVIQHVYEQVAAADSLDAVFVATDDKRIFDVVNNFGGKAVMTSSSHISGTDRIAEAAKNIDCEIIVNVQSDEPFIRPEMVDDTVKLLVDDPRAAISTLAKKTTNMEEILSPNVVKVVMDNEGFAMYFSRSPIPYYRDEWQTQVTDYMAQNTDFNIAFKLKTQNLKLKTFYCFKHIGIYGFRKEALLDFSLMGQGVLEMIEKLEQLRALASGMKIKVKETTYDTFGIDTVEDLRKAEEWLSLSS